MHSVHEQPSKRRVTEGGLMMISAALVCSYPASGQNQPAPANEIEVVVRWDGTQGPSGVNGPASEPFERKGSTFVGSVPRPQSGVRFHDVEVIYRSEAYPLRVRVHPHTDRVQVPIAIDYPKSCADVHLKRLEKWTPTQIASIKAAFTLGYLIDGRAGENSCEEWPLRAAKARFERYQNAVERSNALAIPEGIKEALRRSARSESERSIVAQTIAGGEAAERQALANALQRAVHTELKAGDVVGAFENSALLLATAKMPEFTSAVSSAISLEALARQTNDLGAQAGLPTEQIEAASEEVPPE